MADPITRRMVQIGGIIAEGFGNYAWVERTSELARELYPDGGQATTMLAEFTTDNILENTLEGNSNSRERLAIPEVLADDQIEDWLVGQAVRAVIGAHAFRVAIDSRGSTI